MGKSIRSKRQKQLRTIKRKALQPSETLKITHLNAKLKAFHKRTADLDNLDTTTATKDEATAATPLAPIDPILLPPVPRSFAHSHPKPRDPADPTVRPYPRGRPREQQQQLAAGRVTFQQALEREQKAMEGVEVEEGKEAEGREAEAERRARVKVERENGGGEVVEVSMLRRRRRRERQHGRSVVRATGPACTSQARQQAQR